MKKILTLCVIILVFTAPRIVFAQGSHQQHKMQHVGVLVGEAAKPVDSVVVAVWQRLSTAMGRSFVVDMVPSIKEGKQWVLNGKLNVLLGPLHVQKKEAGLTYFDSYVQDSVGIVVPEQAPGFFWWAAPLLEWWFSAVIIGLVVIFIIIGALIWLVEKRHNPSQFPSEPIKGIAHGIWFTLVTMTTVGYGDNVPITIWGRLIAGVWMSISLVIISGLTVVVTADLTHSRMEIASISHPSQLHGKRVVYINSNKDAELLAERYGTRPVGVKTIIEAMQLIREKKVSAGFISRIKVRSYLHKHPLDKIALTDYSYVIGNYAFVTKSGNPHLENWNQALLTMSELGTIKEIEKNILGIDTGAFLQK